MQAGPNDLPRVRGAAHDFDHDVHVLDPLQRQGHVVQEEFLHGGAAFQRQVLGLVADHDHVDASAQSLRFPFQDLEDGPVDGAKAKECDASGHNLAAVCFLTKKSCGRALLRGQPLALLRGRPLALLLNCRRRKPAQHL